MPVCKVVEVLQDFLSEYVDKKFTRDYNVILYLSIFNSFRVIRCLGQCVSPKISFLPHFCFPWGRPCGSHAKRCMNEKTIQCLPNTLQHVPTYLQHFPSYSNRKCKKSPFSRTAAHSQCSFSKDRCDMVKYTGYDDHLRCDVLNCLELVNDAVSHSNQ